MKVYKLNHIMELPTLQEIHKLSFKLHKNTEADAVWNQNKLAIRIDKDITIMEAANNLYPDNSGLDVTVSAIPCPLTSVTSELLESYKNKIIPLSELIELQVDPGLLPHNPELLKEGAMFMAIEWSPVKLYSNRHIIATMTNFGQVEMFGLKGNDWVSVLELSQVLKGLLNIECGTNYNSNREVAQTLITTAMCWVNFHSIESCIFITSQRNGDVLFWTIANDAGTVKAKLLTQIKIDISIANLFSIPISESSFILLYTTMYGELYSINCNFEGETVTFSTDACLWKHKDKMVVQHLKSTYIENKLILVFAKHCHLVTICYNNKHPEQSVVSFINVDDERITCLAENNNAFYVSTENFSILKINLDLKGEAAVPTTQEVQFKDNYSKNCLYHVSISTNGLIWALCTLERNIASRGDPIKVSIILFEAGIDETKILLSNPTRNLAHVWDCIELLRYKSIKHKILPEIDYAKLYKEGQTDLYKLRLLLVFVKLINQLKLLKSDSFGPELPDITEEKVKELILFKHAQNLLNTIMMSYKNGKDLTDIQIDSCIFIKDYLKYYCKKYSCSMDVDEDVSKIDFSRKYECHCCDEDYNGHWFGSEHMNIMCSVTFSQINSDDYLHCPKCSVTARIELFDDCPTCTFCDAVLIKI